MNLNISIKELLQNLDAQSIIRCDVDDTIVVHSIAGLEQAGQNDLAIILDRGDASVFDAVSLQAIEQSKAGVFLAKDALVSDKKYILVQDPLAAFDAIHKAIKKIQSQTAPVFGTDVNVHSSAVIECGSTVGEYTQIGAHVFVGQRCVIGKNVILYPGVKILDDCVVGDNSILHAGAVIGSDGFGYQVGKTGMRKIPQVGNVIIGKHVEMGANCMIDRASFGSTIIGDGVKLDNGVHVAHNVKIGPSTAVLAQTCIGGSAVIGYGCQIGGQVAIKDHIKIGNGVKIVSKSGVMNDLKDGETVAGLPAIPFNQWKRLVVSLNRVPDILKNLSHQQTFIGAQRSWWQRLFQ